MTSILLDAALEHTGQCGTHLVKVRAVVLHPLAGAPSALDGPRIVVLLKHGVLRLVLLLLALTQILRLPAQHPIISHYGDTRLKQLSQALAILGTPYELSSIIHLGTGSS